jgi:dolichyl-diphosphooligosaccharide--protein glycosyltransferase
MQFTAVFIKKYIVGDRMSLNDVCCYVPAWFGALATLVTGLLAYECSIPIVSETDNGEEPFGSILECIPGISFLYKRTFQPVMKVIFETMEKFIGTDFGLRHNTVMPGHKGWVDVSSPAVEIALVTGMVMSIIPAHLMRSMGGGFDNESVAMFAMVLTFYMWTRSLRGGMKVDSAMTWVWGAGTGLAYFNVSFFCYAIVWNLVGRK